MPTSSVRKAPRPRRGGPSLAAVLNATLITTLLAANAGVAQDSFTDLDLDDPAVLDVSDAADQGVDFRLSDIPPFFPYPDLGGIAAADFDNDGDIDFFLPNLEARPDRLLRNNGDGTFTDVANQLGVDGTFTGFNLIFKPRSRAALWLDHDGDRRLDLFVLGDCVGCDVSDDNGFLRPSNPIAQLWAQARLFQQLPDGTFDDVTNDVDLHLTDFDFLQDSGGPSAIARWTLGGLAAGDLNGDTLPDIVVGHWTGATGGTADHTQRLVLSDDSSGSLSYRKIDVIEDTGTCDADGPNLGSTWQTILHDFDRDGHLDLMNAVDTELNTLWLHRGTCTIAGGEDLLVFASDGAASRLDHQAGRLYASSAFDARGYEIWSHVENGEVSFDATDVEQAEFRFVHGFGVPPGTATARNSLGKTIATVASVLASSDDDKTVVLDPAAAIASITFDGGLIDDFEWIEGSDPPKTLDFQSFASQTQDIDFMGSHWSGGYVLSRSAPSGTDMGIAVGDYDNDGRLDFYVTNNNTTLIRMDQILRPRKDAMGLVTQTAEGTDIYVDEIVPSGIDAAVRPNEPFDEISWNWGTTFFDADLDGFQDLVIANWNLGSGYDADQFFLNDGDGTFTEESTAWGFDSDEVSSGLIAADFDRDGDPDLAEVTGEDGAIDGRFRLLRNDTASTGGWLTLRPRPVSGNTHGLGALVTVTARYTDPQKPDLTSSRLITAGVSFLSQEPAEAHFAFGDDAVDEVEVEIEWPETLPNGSTTSTFCLDASELDRVQTYGWCHQIDVRPPFGLVNTSDWTAWQICLNDPTVECGPELDLVAPFGVVDTADFQRALEIFFVEGMPTSCVPACDFDTVPDGQQTCASTC